MSRKILVTLLFLFSSLVLTSILRADTADDYYREANTFVAQKDYQRAFDAYQGAIPYDVDPYRAYLGMGNCQYYLNNKEKAVEYLQKSDDLHKDEKVEAFIKKIRTSMPAPKTALFVKAEQLLKDHKYKEAIPTLKEIEQYEAANIKAFYDMGYCYYEIGDKPMAALNFAYYVEKTSDAAVTALSQKMKTELSADDQDWLEAQLLLGPPFSPPFTFSGVGIRFEPTFQFVSLKDFNNFNTELQYKASQAPSSDAFALTSTVPPGALAIELNPYTQISQDLEVGLTFGTLFLGQMNESYTSNTNVNGGDAAITYSVITVGLSIRSEMVRLYKNKIKFFFEVDPSYYMTSVNVANSEITSLTPDANFDFPEVTGNFTGSGIGARFKMGVDWKPIPNSIVSGFVGFQMAQIQGFGGSGSVPDGTPHSGNTVNEPGQLMTVQGANGTQIIFVPTGTINPTASPLTLDLSGIMVGADMTILL